jgi:uncharacterized membrane protein YcgQ (UPF0703/DUF1980 family)
MLDTNINVFSQHVLISQRLDLGYVKKSAMYNSLSIQVKGARTPLNPEMFSARSRLLCQDTAIYRQQQELYLQMSLSDGSYPLTNLPALKHK